MHAKWCVASEPTRELIHLDGAWVALTCAYMAHELCLRGIGVRTRGHAYVALC